MDKRILILHIIIMTCLYGYSQETTKSIQFKEYTINLDTVDLNKGSLIEKGNTIRKSFYGEENAQYEIKLYTSLSKNAYVIVFDTSIYNGGNTSTIQFYNLAGELLNQKYFPGLFIYSCYMSSSGEIVTLELFNEDFAEVQIYSNHGTFIVSYKDYHENFYTDDNHHYFLKMKGTEINNKYDLIDKSGNITEIEFPSDNVNHIEFSKGGYYYRVIIDNDQFLYDMNHELVWKIPLNFGLINFFTAGKSISVTKSTNTLEIRDLVDQEVFCAVNSIDYNGEKLGFFYYGLVDDHFYLVERVKGKWIFAFFDFNCEQVYYDFVNVRTTPSYYNVTKSGDKFDIIIKKERDY